MASLAVTFASEQVLFADANDWSLPRASHCAEFETPIERTYMYGNSRYVTFMDQYSCDMSNSLFASNTCI